MREPILVINAGSSSVKFSVYETAFDRSLSEVAHGQVEGIGSAPRLKVSDTSKDGVLNRAVSEQGHDGAIAAIHAWFTHKVGGEAELDGVGHRVVHGGLTFSEPILIDEVVMAGLEQLVPLAPIHQPHSIAAIRAISAVASHLPQVACFDTAFHRGQPTVAQEFALPRALTVQGVRRYGFHGLSYEYIVSVLPKVAPDCARGNVVVAHLGNGASMCAIKNGHSIATTMGFSTLDGLPMGTRTGAIDPGVILYLLQHEHMKVKEIESLLYEQSGLLGVSGISGDMRTLLATNASTAREAVDLFVYRIGRELGSLVAALQGLDALVFTGGIGENSAEIRARVGEDANWLGIKIDGDANVKGRPLISMPSSVPSAWIIPTDENLMIGRHTRRLLDTHRS